MKFEFDPAKSKANAEKHKIYFVAAQALWADEDRLEVPLNFPGEPRWLLVAQLDGKLWTTVFTRRGDKLRIISVRRARDDEKDNMSKTKKTITAEEFDRRFDNGEDISEFIDWSKATRPGWKKNRVNVDMPQWMIQRLDRVSGRQGIARQALIKSILAKELQTV